MFERFTDQARRVLLLAQEEARLADHNYLGTEHILLGLIHEGEGVAAKVLESLGVSLEAAREKVEESVGPRSPPTGPPPVSPRAKKVLELSLREVSRARPQLHRHRALAPRPGPGGREVRARKYWPAWASTSPRCAGGSSSRSRATRPPARRGQPRERPRPHWRCRPAPLYLTSSGAT